MSRSAAGDGAAVTRDDDDVSLVIVDHVSPSSARSTSCRLPASSSSGAVTADSYSLVGRRASQFNVRRKSPSPSLRLPAGGTGTPNSPLSAVRRTSTLRRKSVAAQPVSPEPELHRGTSLHRPDSGSTHGVGYRLGRRKVLAERRKRLADYSLLFALFGVVTMMVEMELTMAELYDKVRSIPLIP